MRLNKFLASKTRLSRRKVDEMISNGLVMLNHKLAVIGTTLKTGDFIVFNEQEFIFQNEEMSKYYLAVNKPLGIECTCDRKNPKNIIDFLLRQPHDLKPEIIEMLYPVGRLDKDSRGLILMTNDGEFCYRMTHPSFQHEKEYELKLDRDPKPFELKKLSEGVEIQLEDGASFTSSPCMIEKLAPKKFRIILKEGKNRQIRRMFQVFGIRVLDLNRVRFDLYELPRNKPLEAFYCKIRNPSV